MTVKIIGAGPGDPELITVKGKKILEKSDLVLYAGSLVNEKLIEDLDAESYDTQNMDLEEIIELISKAEKQGKEVVRLHSGDPSLYGAIVEQMAEFENHGIDVEIIPGVSSVFASTASLKTQLTLKNVSESVIFTRPAGKTLEKDKIEKLSKCETTLVIFLGISKIEDIIKKVKRPDETPVSVVYKASWDDEKIINGKLGNIVEKVKEAGIEKSALILIGEVLEKQGFGRSQLYSK